MAREDCGNIQKIEKSIDAIIVLKIENGEQISSTGTNTLTFAYAQSLKTIKDYQANIIFSQK